MEPRWTRGEEMGEVVAPVRQKLLLTALGGSAATPRGGLEAPVVMVENVAALHELLRRKPDAVRGAIVFCPQRMPRSRDGGGYGATVPIRFSGPFEAAKAGAAGVLIRTVGTTSSGCRTRRRKVGKREQRRFRRPPRFRDPTPTCSSASQAADWSRSGSRSAARPFRTGRGRTSSERSGFRTPEEIVLLAAHLDSWDLGTGAIDDGAGVGIVIEAARLIASFPARPSRTIRRRPLRERGKRRPGLARLRESARSRVGSPRRGARDGSRDRPRLQDVLARRRGRAGRARGHRGDPKPLGIAETRRRARRRVDVAACARSACP